MFQNKKIAINIQSNIDIDIFNLESELSKTMKMPEKWCWLLGAAPVTGNT